MGDNTPSHSFPPPPPPPPPPYSSPKITIPLLYYGLAVVSTAALVLILYNLIIIRWCSNRRLIRSTEIATQGSEPSSSQSFDNPNIRLVSSFKYTKEKGVGLGHDELDEYECPICLSVFEEGEDVRQLPSCNHSFHVPCIDMWLFSHADCPVCRATVEPPLVWPPNHRRNLVMDRVENSRQGLMDITVLL